MKKKSLFIFFLCALLVVLWGCGSSERDTKQSDDDNQIRIYYTNKTGTSLVYETRKRSDITDNQMIADTLVSWMAEEPENKKYFAAIPSEAVINNVVARNNIVNIDFAVGYENLDKDKDVICRAAIVKTLVQMDGIDYVEFSIGGKTMMDADGTPIGSLTADSFVFGELPMKEEK